MNKQIIDKIKKYDVVTFDVFDTLVKRDYLRSSNMLEIVKNQYRKEFNRNLPFYFARERIHSPKVVARKKPGIEVDIDSMYKTLHIENCEKAKQYELDAEIMGVTKNPLIYEIYEYCKREGKKIYAISDMYLSESCIRKMLEKCGYEIDKIYVSQEHNASKISGDLFEKFLREEKLSSSDVIHIGDNMKADVIGAQKNGICSIHIKNINDNPCYTSKGRSLQDNILYKFINNRVDKFEYILEKTGYEVIGPILYYFTQWLHDKIVDNEIEKVFFLSRDGYLLEKAYEDMYGKSDNIKYLQISSKAVRNACNNTDNQKEYMVQYLKGKGFTGKVAIVDIGWSGNLHKMLKNVSKDFADVYGFYFGTFSKFKKNVRDGVSDGFLKVDKYTKAQVFMSAGFIEILFSDTYNGTVEKYDLENEKYVPVLSENNPNGNCLRLLQNGALCFVDDWNASKWSCFKYSSKKLIEPFLRLSICPKDEDVQELANDFVGSGKEYKKLSGDDKNYSISNVKEMLSDMQSVAWKGGFCKKCFKHNIANKVYGYINPFFVMLMHKV